MSLVNIFESVEEWCIATDITIPSEPTSLSVDRANLRYNLLDEENKEYLDAVRSNDLVEIADALGDMLYVLVGTMLEHGMQNHILDVFDEIHKSNMSKMDESGKPILRDDGKILKGPNFFKPNIINKYLK